MGAAVIGAAAAQRAERRIIDTLRREGATRPDRAAPLDDLSVLEQRRLDRLVNARAVRPAPGDRYWLDEEIYRAYRSDRRGLVLVMLGIVIATLLGVLLTQAF
jgi:hypothetical protein